MGGMEGGGRSLHDTCGGEGRTDEAGVHAWVTLVCQIDTYETITHNWLRKEVLNGFLDSCREAISRNAAMFRKDEERADNVLEVGEGHTHGQRERETAGRQAVMNG